MQRLHETTWRPGSAGAIPSALAPWRRATLMSRLRRVLHGLRQPRSSGDYKYARLQMLRLLSPASALLFVLMALLLLSLIRGTPPEASADFVRLEPEPDSTQDPLDRLAPLTPPPAPDQTEAFEEAMGPEALVPDVVVAVPTVAPPMPDPSREMSLMPTRVTLDFSRHIGPRQGPAREQALADNRGTPETEAAVLRALRWLKKHQEADGSWRTGSGGGPEQFGGARPAMTGLALLAYLAHGETPKSEEFGATVERALKWLIANQTDDGHFRGADEHDYAQPIAAYALCEAAALTRIPTVKDAAGRAVARIVAGQNPDGLLWNYNFDPRRELRVNTEVRDRNDLSFSAWCMQALKAATLADLKINGVEASLEKAVLGVKRNAVQAEGGTLTFGYTRGQAPFEITGAGVLCLQLTGGGRSRDVQQALRWLQRVDCRWAQPWADNALYHWYYVTQAKFHAGGSLWNDWNAAFSREVTQHQRVEPAAVLDASGALVDIGYWESPNGKSYCDSRVYNTTLCTLMLEVYYRQIATYRQPAEAPDAPTVLGNSPDDFTVQVL